MGKFQSCLMKCPRCGWTGDSAKCTDVADPYEWDTWYFACPECGAHTELASPLHKEFCIEKAHRGLKLWYEYFPPPSGSRCPYDEHTCLRADDCLGHVCGFTQLSKSPSRVRNLVGAIGLLPFVTEAFILDSWGDYELLDMSDVIRVHGAKYLLMINPSTAKWHLEGVPRDCYSIKNALHRRKPEALRLIPVSDQGDDWYQQGDVCIWPENAIMVKEFPIILT